MANPFQDRLGSRVLPRFLGVANDPHADRHGEVPLLGGYRIDNEGVPARRTELVQNGLLKTLLPTRSPVQGIPRSTGSRRGSGPAPSNPFVQPRDGLDRAEMKQELLDLARERDLEFTISVRRLGSPGARLSGRRGLSSSASGSESEIEAVVAYRVFPDLITHKTQPRLGGGKAWAGCARRRGAGGGPAPADRSGG